MTQSFIARWNQSLLDEEYQRWKRNNLSISSPWSIFFEGFELGCSKLQAQEYQSCRSSENEIQLQLIHQIENILYKYRSLGHMNTQLDPLSKRQRLWDIKNFGLETKDLEEVVSIPSFRNGEKIKVSLFIEVLEKIYCGHTGIEFMHLQNQDEILWLLDQIEKQEINPALTPQEMLHLINEAEMFENFLHTSFVGTKRFSLEGCESVMIALHEMIESISELGVSDILMAMAHRGRLNVLANFLNKPLTLIFNECHYDYYPNLNWATGDVKYHLGYQTVRKSKTGKNISVKLASNPSHLEFVNSVVLGKTRAYQDQIDTEDRQQKILPLLIHGDASIAGQGIVFECLNFSQLSGYSVGGCIHLIINNQIGFTTLPNDSRSSIYCTDVAKTIGSPIFHVNSNDPIAVAKSMRIATAFRQKFKKDVFLDIIGYRRYGHNEGDEPSFTQPVLYQKITNYPRLSTLFFQEQEKLEQISASEFESNKNVVDSKLKLAMSEMKDEITDVKKNPKAYVANFSDNIYSIEKVKTSISAESFKTVVEYLTLLPQSFDPIQKIQKMLILKRQDIFSHQGKYDWGFAESLAFGSLLLDGVSIRISGQDSQRGTFSHRHSLIFDQNTGLSYSPLKKLSEKSNSSFFIYNSPLSEASVLGFDYGYSLGKNSVLCIWEAQFGDFANGAQVIIDQFIASGEQKWFTVSSLVMLLPHGYEGQGPEHSSARLERILQLCAMENIQVCNPTTPAQYFHLLRRQIFQKFRKPLIILSPKSLLRSEQAMSCQEDFITGQFEEILVNKIPDKPEKIEKIILCSGKIYYDLNQYSQEHEMCDRILIVRLEQIYPLRIDTIKEILCPYLNRKESVEIVWCQEEPENMGAWSYLLPIFYRIFGKMIKIVARSASASPATGFISEHKKQQSHLIHTAISF